MDPRVIFHICGAPCLVVFFVSLKRGVGLVKSVFESGTTVYPCSNFIVKRSEKQPIFCIKIILFNSVGKFKSEI